MPFKLKHTSNPCNTTQTILSSQNWFNNLHQHDRHAVAYQPQLINQSFLLPIMQMQVFVIYILHKQQKNINHETQNADIDDDR